MYRVFTGININNDIKKSIIPLCSKLPNARFISEENLHITLNFIGNVDGSLLSDISDSLQEINFKSFSIKFSAFGIFPYRGEPETLWIGIKDPEKLYVLHKKIEFNLSKFNLKKEKRQFHPHLTIAKLKNTTNFYINNFLKRNSLIEFNEMIVNEFILFKSILSSKNAIYQPLFSYLLD